MESIYLFPTNIFRVENFLNEEQCKHIADHFRNDSALSAHDELTGNALSTHYNDRIAAAKIGQLESCKGFEENLLTEFNKAAEMLGINSLSLDNSWVNYQYKESTLNYHSHPMSILSCALYLKVDEYSSSICFYNPNPFSTHWTMVKEPNMANFTTYEYSVKNGDLFIFPSWLKHSGGNKNMSEERVVFSCNTKNIRD